jgi:serine/threonine protein kinase
MIDTTLKSRYNISYELGKSGFGETYVAQDLDIPTKPFCVVKRLRSSQINENTFKLFEQRGKILTELGENYFHIPKLYAFFRRKTLFGLGKTHFYIVQEYINQEQQGSHSLHDILKEVQKLSESQVIQLLKYVLEVLNVLHKNNIIHGDIVPNNILIEQNRIMLLIDFGAFGAVKKIKLDTNEHIPSEQALGKPKFSSDIYVLGMTAIQALTGSKYDSKIIWWESLINVSDNLAIIINKMTNFRADDRYENAGLVLQALNQAFSPGSQTIKLQTAKADFRKLDQLLYQGKWKEADEETTQLMYKCAGIENAYWLDFDSCRNFPQDELRIIDQLWLKHSLKQFGFSVQKEIWLKHGGKLNSRHQSDVYDKLGEEVGWEKEKQAWEKKDNDSYKYFYNLLRKKGHFPTLTRMGTSGICFHWEFVCVGVLLFPKL